VLEAVEAVRREVDLGRGRSITATQMCERFGFAGNAQWTPVGELSGGERRRLQLLRLLMDEPNVLLLDEPTNDLDIDTLTALEDLLDGWPGTLLVVSHDRYFVERVCDDVHALGACGALRHLPGGIEQYVEQRRDEVEPAAPAAAGVGARGGAKAPPAQAVLRAARKEVQRLERAIERLGEREAALHEDMAAAATDHARLQALTEELRAVTAEREALEAAWLETAETLEAGPA
jgi:ABC transport system ATP-binding/permease protein